MASLWDGDYDGIKYEIMGAIFAALIFKIFNVITF